jgi:hypothetical protein
MVLGISLFWFVRHCWRKRDALVNLRVLRDRNFAVGCMLIFLLGFTIYITISILPLFYQEVLGYTALTAGLVVGPRGIGSMLGLPVIGAISNRIDNRFAVSAGFIAFGICTLYFSISQSVHRPAHAAGADRAHRLRAQLRLRPHLQHGDLDAVQRKYGQCHLRLQPAAQHRRFHRHRHGADLSHTDEREQHRLLLQLTVGEAHCGMPPCGRSQVLSQVRAGGVDLLL